MRLRHTVVLALLSFCLPAFADTMMDFDLQGYGSVYVPTSLRKGHTVHDTTIGTATLDVDTQTFTKFEFTTYEGLADYSGTQLNGEPCTSDDFYSCLCVSGDISSGLSFNFSDQEFMVYFKRGYDRIDEEYFGTLTPASSTPEPSSFLLLGSGLLGVAGVLRRRLA